MTPPNTPRKEDPRTIAAKLTAAQREALAYEERTHLEACELNALGLVHMDVVKDADGTLIDLRTRRTPLGEAVRAHPFASQGNPNLTGGE